MKNKLSILIIGITLNIGFVSSQIGEKNFLLSDTKFEIFRRSLISNRPNYDSPELYLTVNLSQNIKDNFSKLSKNSVMQLLADTTTDWATNLLLYEKYDRDAYLFYTVIQVRKDWLPVKESDIAYWRRKLK